MKQMVALQEPILEEKLKKVIVAELKRQVANRPQALQVESSSQLVVNSEVDLDALAMVVAGSIAEGARRVQVWAAVAVARLAKGTPMTKRKPVTSDPSERVDWGSHAQTKEPWKGNPETEQRSTEEKHDLEK
jgi:hypothetical protein